MKIFQKFLLVAVLGLLLAGCKNNEPNGGVYKDLSGTTWEADVSEYLPVYETQVFKFTTSTTGIYYYVYANGKRSESNTLSYSYDYPTIVVRGLTYTFSNKWTFRRTSYNGIELIFREK